MSTRFYYGQKDYIEQLNIMDDVATASSTSAAASAAAAANSATQAANSAAAAASLIEDQIVDGQTTKAPSQNAVYDALALKAPLASPTFTGTVSGVTKAMVGLGNVDNTADANKNVLSATKLATARNINGVAFDGTTNITVADSTKLPLTGGSITGSLSVDGLLSTTNATTNTYTALFTKGGSDPNFRLGFRNGTGSATNTEQAALSFQYNGTETAFIGFNRGGAANAGAITFSMNGTEAGRFDGSGNLLVGVIGGTYHAIKKAVSNDVGAPILAIVASTNDTAGFYGVSGGSLGNAANAAFKVNKDATTSRSINASGTINASGADYAEYMRKADDCGVLVKGQIVGVDAQGRLTDKWAEAKSFLIKSTNPSYVGGDTWGSEEALGISRPTDTDAEDYEDQLALFEEVLEEARQKVDRIAYCGQVPVNVMGAEVGQYVVPMQDGDGIGAILVDEDDITLKQYMKAVGIVQNILPDGRANVRVKPV